MAKCTGVRCPMQYGYKVEECNHTDCPYRTEPITNADRIREMSDEELEDLFREVYNNGCDDATSWEWGIRQNTFIWDEEWLQQPAE